MHPYRILLIIFCMPIYGFNLQADMFSYSASLTGASHYVWRGVSQSNNLFALQPSFTIEGKFTENLKMVGNYWASQTNADDYSQLDDQGNPTRNRPSWENDLTLSLAYEASSWGLSVGALQYIYSYGNDYRKWKKEGKNTFDPDSLEIFFTLTHQRDKTGLSYTQYMNQTNTSTKPYHILTLSQALSTASINLAVGFIDVGEKGNRGDSTVSISKEIDGFQISMNVTAVSWTEAKETNNFPWLAIGYTI